MSELTLEQMKANRKLWVEALRSGKYKQGTDWLNKDGNMCCIGVLCEVAGLEWEHTDDGPLQTSGETRVAPRAAREFVGLRDNSGGYLIDDEDAPHKELTDLNDSGISFAAIADVIESEPLDLFVESMP